MALVLGLGNPGERYARTRHNVGWRVLDELARRWKADVGECSESYSTWRARVGARDVILMIPLGFMNVSGASLAAWRERHEFDSAQLLVVTDDVYLPVGSLRIRPRGSSGGHRGLASIEEAFASREYARVRIGVGYAESARLREHVLETFDEAEERTVSEVVLLAADAVECWTREGIAVAMNRFNRRVRREVSEP